MFYDGQLISSNTVQFINYCATTTAIFVILKRVVYLKATL